jgi:NADH-quinone oxidoreductase subunit E
LPEPWEEETGVDSTRIAEIIEKHGAKPASLIQVLLEIQHENHWLPREALHEVSRRLDVPFSKVLQITSFYKTFRLVPPGRHCVEVCTGSSCHVRGATRLLEELQDLIRIGSGGTDPGSPFSLETGACLGCCNLAPDVIVDGKHQGRMTPALVREAVESCK